MPTIRTVCGVLVTSLLLLLCVGCDAGSEPLAPVRGRVSYHGVPLRSGTIVFAPDELRGTEGALAQADINADGTYLLYTGDRPGAVVGWHRVTIVAMESSLVTASSGSYLLPKGLLPEKYSDPGLSGLSCEVKAKKENWIDFNLD
jgi:hypothetical protein